MELFKQINNEALSEDLKIQREVIERLKKQVALFNQPYKAPVELSDTVLNNIQRYIINFDDNLNKTLNDVYKKGELKEDTGDLILNYNLLANYLDKVNFSLANINDKREVFEILDEIAPKLAKVLSIIKVKDYTDVDLVEKVLNNFKNHTYDVILEKERNQVEREKEKDGSKSQELSQLSPKEQKIKRLEDIIMKTEKIADVKQLQKNSVIYKAYNEANTLLTAVKENKEDLGRLNKFLREKEERINREYDAIFKPKVAEQVAEAQEEEAQPEEAQEGLAITPALQQGAEEPEMPELELPTLEELQKLSPKKFKKLEKKFREEFEPVEPVEPIEPVKQSVKPKSKRRQFKPEVKQEGEPVEGSGKMKKRVYKKY